MGWFTVCLVIVFTLNYINGEKQFSSTQLSRPDLSCIKHGLVKAPLIDNAAPPRYVRRKTKQKLATSKPGRRRHRVLYLEAVYSCAPGYEHFEGGSLYCSKGRWLGEKIRCEKKDNDYTATEQSDAEDVSCGPDNGGCEHDCKMVDGKPQCSCHPGFQLEDKSCKDVNECLTLNGGCDHVCENLPGSHRCSCRRGWRLGTHPGSCEDVNECLLNNGHGPCAHACVNTPGGHKCTCEGLPGTRLAPDGRRCLLTHQKLDCQELAGCSHSCLLVRAGTSVFCTCPDGLQLGTDWKTCQDINECSFPEISQSCPHCQNTFGSYHCTKTLPELAELNLPPSSIQSHPTVQAHVISPHQSLETNSHINQSNPLHDPHSFPLDQSIPDHVVCPPLFPPRHGFIECERGNAAPVNWKAPSGRKRITNRPGSICELTCPVGYKKHGRWKKICGKNGLWEGEDTGKCEQYPPPMIKCANPIVNRLKSGESHLKIQIPPPVSSLEPKYIRSEPILRNLTLTAPRGQHWVHFTARHPITGLTAKCTVFVVVKGAPGT